MTTNENNNEVFVQKKLQNKVLLEQANAYLSKGETRYALVGYKNILARSMDSDFYDDAIICLEKLIMLAPKEEKYYEQLAAIFASSQNFKKAVEVCHQQLSIRPKLAVAHFNKAYYLRLGGEYEPAIKSYQRALQLDIDHKDEVHLNLAVIYSNHLNQYVQAQEHFKRAILINPENLAAYYNLATLYEDLGDKENTRKHFTRILKIQPDHPQALARIAYLDKVVDKEDELIERLLVLARSKNLTYSEKLNVLYALAKVLDDCGEYKKAFHYYKFANQLNASGVPHYNKGNYEHYIQSIIDQFSDTWIKNSTLPSIQSKPPVFICGMFRSGSTLTEQILAAHPDVTAGGERDFFVKETRNRLEPFPKSLQNTSQEVLNEIASDYLLEMNSLFPDAHVLTDKRPDNLLYIGLIKTLYPNAKIIHTLRNPVDNCLSVYFLRLGQAMNYATDLENIAHYYQQQMRLMQHWKSLFPDSIYTIEYENLVGSPQETITNLLKFLGLNMHADCLDFHAVKNAVKTASVWQVRQPLYTQSAGRWRNYAGISEVQALIKYIEQEIK